MTTYTIEIQSKEYNEYTDLVHDGVKGRPAVLLEAKEGYRGWIAYKVKDALDPNPWHRLHISTVISVKETYEDIVVETLNTIYILKKKEEESE